MESLKAKGKESAEGAALDIRPGGLFVQKRESVIDEGSAIPRTISVRVRFGDIRRDVRIRPQASFGELKKLLTDYTRIHHLDQKIFFKKVEKHSNEFLDESGIKEGSKLVVVEDPNARDRRCLEMLRSSSSETAKNSIQKIGSDADKIQGEVKECESAASRGEKTDEKRIDNLIDALMYKLVALNRIHVNGSLKMEKNLLEGRVKKQIEVLDSLMVRKKKSTKKVKFNLQEEILQPKEQPQKLNYSDEAVFTTKWVTFE